MNSGGLKSVALATGVLFVGVLAGCDFFRSDSRVSGPLAQDSASSGMIDDSPRVASNPAQAARQRFEEQFGSPDQFFITPSPPTFDRMFFAPGMGAGSSYGLYLYTVSPNCGPLAGGTAVDLGGNFPIPSALTAVQAAASYYVYFGGVLATFDSGFDPNAADATNMHVITPVGPTTGDVDVTICSVVHGAYTYNIYTTLVDGFTYFEPLELASISPAMGPLTGGTQVTLTAPGSTPFPIHTASLTAAQAAMYYTVTFQDIPNGLSFDGTFVDVASVAMTYTTATLTTPPFPIPSLVDVVISEIGNACNTYTLPLSYQYEGFELTSIDPQYGYTRGGYVNGGMQATLTGSFPIPSGLSITDINNAYDIFFDTIATNAQIVAMDATYAYVIVPPHAQPGLVDVTVRETLNPADNFDTLTNAFEYVALELINLEPARGPTGGGTSVIATAFISTPSDITTIAAAYNAYSLYFDGDLAGYDASEPTLVVAPQANTIPDRTLPLSQLLQEAGKFYIVTPPHTPPEFVDVLAVDMFMYSTAQISYNYTQSYEYIDSEIGDWVGVEIIPEIIGAVESNEVEIKIETTARPPGGWNSIELFIVPQGGDPADEDHRIPFTWDGTEVAGTNLVTTWTNDNAITTIVLDRGSSGVNDGDGDLFADGHAAIYIETPGPPTDLIGDDYISPFTDGIISNDNQDLTFGALDRRHVLIDTIPPVMTPDPTAIDPFDLSSAITAFARDIVTPDATQDGVLGDIVGVTSVNHPAAVPGGVEQATDEAPDDDGLISNGSPGAFGPGAQMFFNMASDAQTNNFATDELNPEIEVRFVDYDLHTYYGYLLGLGAPLTQDAVFDEDQFNPGTTDRQASGFDPGAFIHVGNTILSRPDERVSDSLLGGSTSEWFQWLLGPNSTRMRPSLRVDLNATRGAVIAGVSQILDSAYVNDVTAVWDFDTTTQPGGVPEPTGSNPLHWEIQFRAHDRGGRVVDTFLPTTDVDRRIWTYPEAFVDPLHIWWLRRTSAKITPNLEGAELFDRTFTFALDRGYDPNADGLDPLFSYRVWESSVAGLGGYDAEFLPIAAQPNWTGFTATNFLSTSDPLFNASRGRWVLLVVLGIDEAGNYGQFPTNELIHDFGDGDADGTDGEVTDFLSASGASWMRIFLTDDAQALDTKIQPTFWYHSAAGANEFVVDGNETAIAGAPVVVQEAPAGTILRVNFDVEAIVEDPADLSVANIFWDVTRHASDGSTVLDDDGDGNGDEVALNDANSFRIQFSSDSDANDPGVEHYELFDGLAAAFQGLITVPTGEPTTYTFRFWTEVAGVEDPTPARFRVTVVRDRAEYVENPDSRDLQPIKESQR